MPTSALVGTTCQIRDEKETFSFNK